MANGNGDDKPARDARGRLLPGHAKLGAGAVKGQKYKTAWDELQVGMADFCRIPLSVLDDIDDRKEFTEKLRQSALKNPPGYMAKIIVPMLKVIPQKVVVEMFASMTTKGVADAEAFTSLQALIRIAIERGVDLDELEGQLSDR